MRLTTKLLLAIGSVMLLSLAVVEYLGYRESQRHAVEDLREEAAIIRALLVSMREVYQREFLDHGLDLDERTLGLLPAHAIPYISRAFAGRNAQGIRFNNVSDRPNNPANAADPIERAAMDYFRAHPEAREHMSRHTDAAGRAYYHYTAPLWVTRTCLGCHGLRADAPPAIREHYAVAYGYREGDLRGILSIKLPADTVEAHIVGVHRSDLIRYLVGFALTFLLASWLLKVLVLDRLKSLRQAATRLSEGDYATRVPVKGRDEVAGVSATLNQMAEAIAEREARLREGRARYRAVVDHVRDVIFQTDREGRWTFLNPAWTVITGYSVEDSLRRSFSNFIHPDDRPVGERLFRELLAREIGHSLHEMRFVARNGAVVSMEVHARMPTDPETGEVGAVGTLRDVTAKRRAEERLRQAARVFESTTEGVCIADAGRRITAVNPAFTRITGYSEADSLGQGLEVLESPRHDQAFYTALWATTRETGQWRGEVWGRRQNGEVYPQWLTVNTVVGEDGAVSDWIAVFSDISTLKESQERLTYLTHHDALTGLPNRLLLELRLEHALERARRDGRRLAILLLDLDRFKNVNDSLGHPVGDRLLRGVTHNLQRQVRRNDTLARTSGDAFAVLMEEMDDPHDAVVVAEKLLDGLRQPFVLTGEEIYLTASVGISVFPGDGQDVPSLVKNAEAAMYRAKDEGRNNYQFYTAELTEAAFERHFLESHLRRALDRQELTVYYQPQVATESGRLIGVEALVRWQHPQLGLVSPAKFIPLAEETGLIREVGAWVLRTACRQAVAWRKAGLPPIRVAVNLSGRQITSSELVGTVESALAESGLDAHWLELEITETSIMAQPEVAMANLTRIKALGVELAIDDFGTGYSSLSYLKRFAVDRLKIDQSFVRDIPEDPHDEAIARAVLALGHSLHMGVVAEGVETEAQRHFFETERCDVMQGFLFSPPVTAEALTAMLESTRGWGVTPIEPPRAAG